MKKLSIFQDNYRPDDFPLLLRKLFVTGGCRGNCCRAVRLHIAEPCHDATDDVWCFCPVTRTCTPAPAMGKPRTMHAAVSALNRLYVIGGRARGPRGGAPSLLEVWLKLQLYSYSQGHTISTTLL